MKIEANTYAAVIKNECLKFILLFIITDLFHLLSQEKNHCMKACYSKTQSEQKLLWIARFHNNSENR